LPFFKIDEAVFQESPFQPEIAGNGDSVKICFFHAVHFFQSASNPLPVRLPVAFFLKINGFDGKSDEEGPEIDDF